MTKCLAIRMCAFGDAFYALPVLEELSRQYDYLHLETGDRAKELFANHPAFSRITVFDVLQYKPKKRMEMAANRWDALAAANDWDRVINFIESIEVSCIADEWQDEYHLPREHRRKIYGDRNFYDSHFIKAGLPIPDPFHCGTMYFSEAELAWMNTWRERHGDEFIVAFALNGSTSQKYPMYFRELAQEIRLSFPETKFVLLGDKRGEQMVFDIGGGSVLNAVGKWPYMQSLGLVKMADYVIGPETGLLVGAGLFGTPKSMVCTSCSPYQATAHQKNDFSVQSTAPCSPCHRSAYTPKWCNYREHPFGLVPDCNFMVDTRPIIEGVAFAHSVRGVRGETERHGGPGFKSLPDLQSLLDQKSAWDEEIRPGVLPEVREVCSDPSRAGYKPPEMGDDFKVSEW